MCAAVLCGSSPWVHAATFTVSSTAASGAGSLDNAIDQANTTAGADTINFAIAGAGPHVLTPPATGYRNISETLSINGYSQAGSSANINPGAATNAILRIEINAAAVDNGVQVIKSSVPMTLRGVAINGLSGSRIGVRIATTTSGSVIAGCFIGLGTAGTGSGSGGVGVSIGAPTQVGGTAAADRNLFGNVGNAVSLTPGSAGSLIQGGLFGTAPNGTGSRPINAAVTVNSAITDIEIGGTAAGAANTIRNAGGPAIFITSSGAQRISIQGNSIDETNAAAIDLGGDGIDPIDPGDGDTGPNGRENTVKLLHARVNGTSLVLRAQLDGDFTSGTKRVEFFLSDAVNSTGSGSGAVLVGSNNINPGPIQGVSNFQSVFTLPATPVLPQFLSATVTSADGSTSEFAAPVPVVNGGVPRAVTNTNDSGAGSFRQLLTDANTNAGVDTIIFAIAGAGPHIISPASALPEISNDLIIDGYNQAGARPNSAATGSNADLRIVLDGSSAGSVNGLRVVGGSLTLRGLNIRGFGSNGLSLGGGSGHLIEGNFIGTDVTGLIDQGNVLAGISAAPAVSGAQIGGPDPHQRNIISGNNGAGMSLSSNGLLVQNNLVGVGADGSAVVRNTFGGVLVNGSGAEILDNNVRNNSRGIEVQAGGQAAIRRNRIASNTGLGIDLNADGVTANDPNDTDSGPNSLQNFPVLNTATALIGGGLRIQGAQDRPIISVQDLQFDIFSSATCDGTGHGEGETWLGSQTVSVAVGVPEQFDFTLPGVTVPAGTVITATVTNGNNETSEFSACINSVQQTDAVFANGFE